MKPWLVVLIFLYGCVSLDKNDGASIADMASSDMACGAAHSQCCVPFGLANADLAGIACLPGLTCIVPDGGATHRDHGICQ